MTLAEQVRAAQLPPPAARRRIRSDARVSLAEVAAELDVSAVTVQRWERGIFEPRREKAIAYRNLLEALQQAAG